MKCAFAHCENQARAGLHGSVELGKTSIQFPLCMSHWMVLGKLEETLGEPHYSVAELEKVHAWLIKYNRNFTARTVIAFLSMLKDKKKVEEILDEKRKRNQGTNKSYGMSSR